MAQSFTCVFQSAQPGLRPERLHEYDVQMCSIILILRHHASVLAQVITLSVSSAGSEDYRTNVTSLYNSASNQSLFQSAQLGLRADKWNQS